MDKELREKMAAQAHLTWQRWMAYMLTNLDEAHIESLKRLANTPYQELPESEKNSDRAIADEYDALYKAAGYVRLDPDQTLPKNPYTTWRLCAGYNIAQCEMTDNHWRKVILEE